MGKKGNNQYDKNKILNELVNNQLKDVPDDKKLQLHDILRVRKNITTSIFDPKECCLWNGYVTNLNKSNKGTYVNFYFKHKKVALHRLLYYNYIGQISKNDYLKYNCNNKGICCNINHLNKFRYNKGENIEETSEVVDKSKKIKFIDKNDTDNNRLCVKFD